jgi:hypothetical protein
MIALLLLFSFCGKCGEVFSKASLHQLHMDLAEKNGGACPVKKARWDAPLFTYLVF